MDLTYAPMTREDRLYAYHLSAQLTAQTGAIGYLRGDFGRTGAEFYSQFFDETESRKSDAFRASLQDVVTAMREPGGPLLDRFAMISFCGLRSEADLSEGLGRSYGFRVDTPRFAYLLRCIPSPGDYNFYLRCYERVLLESHMEAARRGIRFITPGYREKFRLPDGDSIRIKDRNGISRDRVCRYIDDYHLESGSSLYHICEFAEMMENLGATVIPLRSSLPEECLGALETEGCLIRIRKGESGYERTGILPDEEQSRQQAADEANAALGVTKAQASAMLAGSMFGWDVPAADPAHYDDKGLPVRSGPDLGAR
jgi:hypothetical protein